MLIQDMTNKGNIKERHGCANRFLENMYFWRKEAMEQTRINKGASRQ